MISWTSEGYKDFLKRNRKKSTPALFNRYIKSQLHKKGVDISLVSNGQVCLETLFWETHHLRAWLVFAFELIANLENQLKDKK